MNINPTSLKTSLKSSVIDRKDLASHTNKKVSFANFIDIKNVLTVIDEDNEQHSLTISLEKKANLTEGKDSRDAKFVPFGSFLVLKETTIEYFFNRKVKDQDITAFELYTQMLTENDPAVFERFLPEEGGRACIMKRVAREYRDYNRLLSLQNTPSISKETQAVFQALNDLTACEILDLQVKDLHSQKDIDELREKALSSSKNQTLFKTQAKNFLDKFVLLKAALDAHTASSNSSNDK